jgi:L-aspartate oxidase
VTEPAPQQRLKTDYLVIGSGIAGMSAALKAAAHGEVTMVTKRLVADCRAASAA